MGLGGEKDLTKEEFVALVNPCRETMYHVAAAYLKCPQDRADAAQNALMKAWQKRNSLHDDVYFKTWLIRILIRECINLQRAYKSSVPIENLEVCAPSVRDTELRDAIERLGTALRLPVILFYLEGYSLSETAKTLRIPQGTVKSRLSRARELLRDELKEDIE